MIEILIVILLLSHGQPLASERIDLLTYLPGVSEWQLHRSGACETDTQGRCQIAARVDAWADRLVRGWLEVDGEAVRPLIWPGGTLHLQVDLTEELHVDGRYEHLLAAPELAPVIRERRPSFALLGMAIVMLFLTTLILIHLKRRA